MNRYLKKIISVGKRSSVRMWNHNQMFLCWTGESRPFPQIQALSIVLLTCREWTNCVIPPRSGAMSIGQDPTHAVAHILGNLPQKNRVMCLVHGGKSIRWNVTRCGTWSGPPFPSKKATPPEAAERSEVRCTQCPPLHTQKPQLIFLLCRMLD